MRWMVLALLFFATTINYLDRIVFSVLAPVIQKELRLTDQDYGNLTGAFQIAYTFGFLAVGKFIDRYGTKVGYAAAILWWSAAATLHAVARTAVDLGFWRAMLGFGEAGNFPAAIKSVAEWFPKKDRAFATGVFNAGSNVASMIGPPVFVWLNWRFGWRASFLVTGLSGFVWLVFWLVFYRRPPEIVDPSAEVVKQVGWRAALAQRPTWGFAIAKFLTDPVWWFYLYWLPKYLFDARKFNLSEIGWALPVVYLMADAGSVGGGWFSGWLMRRGMDAPQARNTAMIACAGCMPVAAMAVFTPNTAVTIALVSLATAAHQGWSANLFTTTSDAFPKESVASVTGIGGFAGGLGGFLFSAVIPGWVVTHFGYTPMFVFMGTLHLVAWFVLRRMMWTPKAA